MEPASPVRNSADWAMLLARCSPSGQQPSEFRDRICSIDSDLTDTEKEGEMLNRKLNKRLSGNHNDLNSEFFLDKLTKWQSNKKVEKLKNLLSEHLPKVKHLEEEIQSSAKSVATDKVLASSQAACLMTLIEQQIEYYQQHMNFLDDVINDIRQCDYTIVREIADIKMAFTFSMELDARQRANSRNITPTNPCSVLMKVGVDSNGHMPSKRILDDSMLIPSIQAAVREKPPVLVVPSPSKGDSEHAEASEHSLAQGAAKPASASASAGPAHDAEEVQVISASSGGRISPSIAKSAASLSNSVFKEALLNSINLNAAGGSRGAGDDAIKGDGTDYKRKCLKSSSINIQSLNLTKRDANGDEEYGSAGNSTPPDGKKKSSRSDKSDKSDKVLPSPRSFMRAVSSKLTEFAQFGGRDGKEAKEEKARSGLKQRCLSVSSGLGDSATAEPAKRDRPGSARVSKSAAEDEQIKNRHRRTLSAGGSFFFPATGAEPSSKTPDSMSPPASAAAASHCTTPRPDALAMSTPAPVMTRPTSPPGTVKPISPGASTCAAELHLGIAEMRCDSEEGPAVLSLARQTSDGGVLSTCSSCSTFSQASTVVTNPADGSSAPSTARSTSDAPGNKRKKYAALLFHYPNLQPCLQDPALKIVAKKLNKCLKFKDELQRSLVKAETVQETETTCLRKLRKVQHELEDLSHHCAHPALTSTDSASATSRLSERHSHNSLHGYRSLCSSGSYSYSGAGTVEGLQSTSGSSQDVLRLAAVTEFDADLRRISSGEKSSSFLQDHDLSSTDDEHEHTNSNSSSQSHEQNGFTLHSTLFEPHHSRTGATSPHRAASFHPSGHYGSGASLGLGAGVSSHSGSNGSVLALPSTYSTEEDPTIIDSSHDAAVSQMSAEILECATRCAQRLKVLLEEEQEVTDKLARVRHLLSSAQHIDEQLLERFAK